MEQPLKDLLIIEVQDKSKEKTTATGIVLPAKQWQEPESLGDILAVGPDVTDLNVGDKVRINPYACIDTEKPTVKIIKRKDVLTKWVQSET